MAGRASHAAGGTRLGARPAGAVLAAALAAAVLAGCGGGGAPDRLLDGSVATVPEPLRDLGGSPVGTKVEVVPSRVLRRSLAACGLGGAAISRHLAVRRVGVRTESVTVRIGTDLRACDRDRSAVGEVGGRWCGTSAGRLRGGHLRDPRLDLCSDSKGRVVAAFAWIEPSPAARFVAVDQPGYREVYRVAGGLPVRISTADDIDEASSSAVFEYTEYSAGGRPLGRKTLRAYVAG